jgi:GntR family transcriptional regulator
VYKVTRQSEVNVYITIDEGDKRPLYQQVVDEIKKLIARGELPKGSTLPPVRQVAADLGVNLNTVAFAYRQLQKDGLIRVRHGSGAHVISQILAKRDEERAQERLLSVLAELLLSGMSRSEVLALVSDSLNDLARAEVEKL